MGYLQALQLMVRAYKAARGVMPKGIDLLKMKMRARQKAIDSTKGKVIKFPPERITDPFKARPQPPKIKTIKGIQTTRGLGDLFKRQMEKIGQKAKQESKPKSKKLEDAMESFFGFKPRRETEAQMLTRMNRQNKESVARLKKKKDLGDKLKDYKGDPDAMREGGIISLANGGLTNISQTYDNNPTLQAQYPNKQDYLDLFSSQTTTTTPQTSTTTQSTTSTIAPINPIKPIIKIPQYGGDGGGSPPPGGGIRAGINLDYGYTGPSMTLADEGEGTILDEDYTLGMRARDAYSGIKNFVKYNPMNPMFMFNVAKAGVEKAKEFAEKVQAQKALEAEQARQAQINAARAALAYQTQTGEGSGYTGGFDPSTQNYDDPFDPGQTE